MGIDKRTWQAYRVGGWSMLPVVLLPSHGNMCGVMKEWTVSMYMRCYIAGLACESRVLVGS